MAIFSANDLEVFTLPGFDERMQALREQIRPKLHQLGQELAEPLSHRVGEPLYPHVAKHARRSVNPPEETWVAFSPNARGYKKYPYLGVAISRFGIHPRVVAKTESVELRPTMAERLEGRSLPSVLGDFWNWDFGAPPEEVRADEAFWNERLTRMRRKTGGLELGRTQPVTSSDPEELLSTMKDFVTLYRIMRGLA